VFGGSRRGAVWESNAGSRSLRARVAGSHSKENQSGTSQVPWSAGAEGKRSEWTLRNFEAPYRVYRRTTRSEIGVLGGCEEIYRELPLTFLAGYSSRRSIGAEDLLPGDSGRERIDKSQWPLGGRFFFLPGKGGSRRRGFYLERQGEPTLFLAS